MYLDMGGHGELAHWKQMDETGVFTDLNVVYYPDAKKEQIPVLLNQEYDKIIMDFGDRYLSFREELMRCDQKILLLNLNPWQEFAARRMVTTVQNEDWGGIRPIYAGLHTNASIKHAVEKDYRIRIKEIPVIPNPRCITADEFSYMDAMLGRTALQIRKQKSLNPIWKRRK